MWWRTWGCQGCAERWGRENLTGFLSWPGKLDQPTNESQTRAEHVMQSRGNNAGRGRRKKKGKMTGKWHAHTQKHTETPKCMGKFQLRKYSQITVDQGSTFKSAKIRSCMILVSPLKTSIPLYCTVCEMSCSCFEAKTCHVYCMYQKGTRPQKKNKKQKETEMFIEEGPAGGNNHLW